MRLAEAVNAEGNKGGRLGEKDGTEVAGISKCTREGDEPVESEEVSKWKVSKRMKSKADNDSYFVIPQGM